MKPVALAALLLAAAPAAAPSSAWAADPAAERVDAFNKALLETMKSGKSLGMSGRVRKLTPAVEAAFDLPTMTRVAVGPDWTKIPAADQDRLVKAFERVNVANWARNFDDYDGERFQLGAVSANASGDKLVRNQIVPKHGEPTTLNFRMRQSGGEGWRIVDVFYNGTISSLSTQRADFQSALQAGGAPALLKKLDAQADSLTKAK